MISYYQSNNTLYISNTQYTIQSMMLQYFITLDILTTYYTTRYYVSICLTRRSEVDIQGYTYYTLRSVMWSGCVNTLSRVLLLGVVYSKSNTVGVYTIHSTVQYSTIRYCQVNLILNIRTVHNRESAAQAPALNYFHQPA